MRKRVIIYVLLLFVTIFTACNQSKEITVEGKIVNAEGKTLFVVHRGLTKDVLLDSVKIGSDAEFRFQLPSPKYPDLYVLKMEQQQIILAVDSAEKISLSAVYPNFLKTTFEHSPESKVIQDYRNTAVLLAKYLQKAQLETNRRKKEVIVDSLTTLLERHKKKVKTNILSSSNLLSSYYALFQQVNNSPLFSLYDKNDLPYFRALATSFDAYMPDYERSKNLYNLVLGVIKEKRETEERAKVIKEKLVNQVGFVDIKLKDKNGYYQKLSDFLGNPIVLNFTLYGAKDMQENIFDLQDFYQKYKNKGVVIYQVGLDDNRLFWEQSVSNKPWVSVHDMKGYYSRLYNVQQIPTYFLLDKKGNIRARYNSLDKLEKDFKRLLR